MAKLTTHNLGEGSASLTTGSSSNPQLNPATAWMYIFNANGEVYHRINAEFETWSNANSGFYGVTLTPIDQMSSFSYGGKTITSPLGIGMFRQVTWPATLGTGLSLRQFPAGTYFVLTYQGYLVVNCYSIFPYVTDHSVTMVYWNGTDFADPIPNNYTMNVSLSIGASTDQYTVTWFKNGVRVTSGITSPTIQVIKRVDASNLIASGIMSQVGTTGTYSYSEPINRLTSSQNSYLIIASATIDGATRSYSKVFGIYSGNVIW